MTKVTGTKNPKKKKDDLTLYYREMIAELVPGAERFYKSFLLPVLSTRNVRWFASLDEYFNKLEERYEEFKIEELVTNETFTTTLMQASRIAIDTHQKEKLEALRNAVLNSALPNAPDDNKQAIFLGLIDDLTPLHLQVLSMYKDIKENNPNDSVKRYELVAEYTKMRFPDFKENIHVYSLILGDLDSRGLVLKEYVRGADRDIPSDFSAFITPMGIEFIEFISSPFGDE